MKNLLLFILFVILFVYLKYLDIPFNIPDNISYFLGNPFIRLATIIVIMMIAENISFLTAVVVTFLYLFFLNNSMRSNMFEGYDNVGSAVYNNANGVPQNQFNPLAPPGTPNIPEGPDSKEMNEIGPLPFRPCESVLASGAPDRLPPGKEPVGVYTDSGIGCDFD